MTDYTTEHDKDLDADAIYQGMCLVRDFVKSHGGKEVLLKTRATAEPEEVPGAAPKGAVHVVIPRMEFSYETTLEDRAAVDFGIDLGAYIIFATEDILSSFTPSDSPGGEAARRFLADETLH